MQNYVAGRFYTHWRERQKKAAAWHAYASTRVPFLLLPATASRALPTTYHSRYLAAYAFFLMQIPLTVTGTTYRQEKKKKKTALSPPYVYVGRPLPAWISILAMNM